jgi:hypothetical protein
LLTLGALELAAVPVVDTVLTPPATADPSTGTNAEALKRLSGVPRVVTVPRTDDPELAAEALRPVAERLLTAHAHS